MSLKKIIIFLITLAIGLAVFSLATSKVGAEEIIKAFSIFPSWGIVVILLLTVLISVVGTWRLKFILEVQGNKLPFLKLFEVWIAGFAISYLTPIAILGGEVFMIYALRRSYPISWEKSASAVFIHKVLDATIFFPFLILGIFTFPVLSGFFPKGGIIIVGGVVAGILITLLAVFYIKSFREESTLDWFLKIFRMNRKKLEERGEGGRLVLLAEKEIVSFFGVRKKEMWQGIGLSLLKYILIIARIFLLIFFLKGSFHVLESIAAYGFFNLAILVPVPAMLGSLEVAEGLVFEGMSFGANVGLAFSLVLRSMDTLFCIIGLVLLVKVGIRLIKIRFLEIVDTFSK